MKTKLTLINYYYTELKLLHERDQNHDQSGAFYRPLFFDFPGEVNAYKNQTQNVMLGKNLKLSIASGANENQTVTDFYFPNGTWCSVYNTSSECIKGPTSVDLSSRLYEFDVHIKDGSIVPLQLDLLSNKSNASKTWDVLQNPVDLHINPQFGKIIVESDDGTCNATGRTLNDDVTGEYTHWNIYNLNFSSVCKTQTEATGINLNISSNIDKTSSGNDFLGKIVIYNTKSDFFNMMSNHTITVVWTNNSTTVLPEQASFDQSSNQTIFHHDHTDMWALPMPEIQTILFDKAKE